MSSFKTPLMEITIQSGRIVKVFTIAQYLKQEVSIWDRNYGNWDLLDMQDKKG